MFAKKGRGSAVHKSDIKEEQWTKKTWPKEWGKFPEPIKWTKKDIKQHHKMLKNN